MYVVQEIQELAQRHGMSLVANPGRREVHGAVFCLLSGFLENAKCDKEDVIRRLKGVFDSVPEDEPLLSVEVTAMMILRVFYHDLFKKFWAGKLTDEEVMVGIKRKNPRYMMRDVTDWLESTIIIGHVARITTNPERMYPGVSKLYCQHQDIVKNTPSEQFYHDDKYHSRQVVRFVDSGLFPNSAQHIDTACVRVDQAFRDFPE